MEPLQKHQHSAHAQKHAVSHEPSVCCVFEERERGDVGLFILSERHADQSMKITELE